MSEAGARLRVALADRDRLERCLREMEIAVTLHRPPRPAALRLGRRGRSGV
jgi:hypothetical protein